MPRVPEIKDRLELSNAALGSAIAAMPVGALAAGLLAPALIQRLGSAKVASLGLVLLAATVAGVPLAGAWAVLAVLMLIVGALDSVVDVAQNAHGFRVQRGYGRSIVNAFHGLWSIGAVVGAVLGSIAAGFSVRLEAHLAVSAVLFSVLAVFAYRHLLPGPEDAERLTTNDGDHHAGDGNALPRFARHIVLLLATFGVLAACGAFVEDAGSSWGALYLRGEIGAGAATAGLAFVALQVAMTAGRLTGDRAVDRFGQRRVARVGGAGIALGMGLAVAVPSLATTVTGFAIAGLGVATLVPAVMHTADELPGLPHGVGLTVVSWLLRVGFLVSPLVVGLVADATNLRAALLGVVLVGLVVVAFGRALIGTASPAHQDGTEAAAEAPALAGPPAAAPRNP